MKCSSYQNWKRGIHMRVTERFAKETGREYALRILKENIIHLDLIPGTMLSENELASEMKLSRTPVREALIELSKSGIVEIFPQKGSALTLIDYSMVEEARFMRNVLECAVVELDCGIEAPGMLEELETNVQLQEFYLKNRSSEKLLELDNQFHRMLFQMAGKPQVYALMGSITIHFDRVRSMSLATVKELKTVSDHRAILDAVRAGDKEGARTLMETHLSRYKIDQEELREKYPGYFK